MPVNRFREATSGFRYTSSTTFETFPFPWPPEQEPIEDDRVKAISRAARDPVLKRDRWLNLPDVSESELKGRTLTTLYNFRPLWLLQAHFQLDQTVLSAYGWLLDITREEIFERLLLLNLENAGLLRTALSYLLIEIENNRRSKKDFEESMKALLERRASRKTQASK